MSNDHDWVPPRLNPHMNTKTDTAHTAQLPVAMNRSRLIVAGPGGLGLGGLGVNPIRGGADSLPVATSSLLLQTVIVPGEKTQEGVLIQAVAIPWFDIISLIKVDPSIIFQIDARKWEEIIAGAYKKAGFDEVTLTPRSGDLGRDVIAIKQGIGYVRVIDQVKAYGPGHLVTADDVRALIGVLKGDGASKGYLTTTSDFAPKLRTDPLISHFIPSQLQLINGAELILRLKELAKTP